MIGIIEVDSVRDEYGPRILILLDNIRAALEVAGYITEGVDEWGYEEYSWALYAKKPGDGSGRLCFDVAVTLLESVNHDGERPLGVNFSMTSTDGDGNEIGRVTPFNYTDNTWVDRDDPESIGKRWSLFESVCNPAAVLDAVNRHYR